MYSHYADEVSDVILFANSLPETLPDVDIPVKFTVIRKADGSGNLTEQQVLDKLEVYNETFADFGFNFVQCGEVTFVDNDYLYENPQPGFFEEASFSSSAVNVYIGDGYTPFAELPCSVEFVTSCTDDDRLSVFMNRFNLDDVYAHEMGHHFGLVHTYQISSATYHTPVEVGQPDHPYDGEPGKARELVLREPNDDKLFDVDNCNDAGDFVCDTPADCVPFGTWSFVFPDPSDPECFQLPALNCTHGCVFTDCNFTGAYVDYNGDSISDIPEFDKYGNPMGSLGRNFMSYHSFLCLDEFTTGQVNRALYYYDSYRAPQYEVEICDNLADNVEYQDTDETIADISIMISHSTNERVFNTITGDDGSFSGTLHDDLLFADVKLLPLVFDPDYTYTVEEWLSGVNVNDVIYIVGHILGITTFQLNGYNQIAADANNSGTVTSTDLVTLRKLILLIDDEFPEFDQPLRFIPEYIPQDYSTSFHNNPFDMLLNGVQYNDNAPYLNADWEYEIQDGNNGKSGFDAIKIGNVIGDSGIEGLSNGNQNCVDFEVPVVYSNLNPLGVDEEIEVEVMAFNFQNIMGYQMGLHLTNNDFELLEVADGDLGAMVDQENYGLTQLPNNEIRFLWFKENGIPESLQNGSVLFKLRLKAKNAINDISTELYKEDAILKTQFFKSDGCLKEVNLEMRMNSVAPREERKAQTEKTSLLPRLHCYPNPFKDELLVTLDLEINTPGIILIRDVYGKTIYQSDVAFHSGRNILQFDKAFENLTPGIYYFNVQTKDQIYASKIIKQ